MKSIRHKAAVLWACCVSQFALAGGIPDGYPVSRYTGLWEHSPFTIASVQQEVVPAGFATKLALVGIAKIGSEDLVILLNKDSQERMNVGINPNEQGIKLISVDSNPDPLKACVTIQKGAEIAKVKYEQALLAAVAAPPNSPANVQPQQPIPAKTMPPTALPQGVNPPVLSVRRRSLPIPVPYSNQQAAPSIIPSGMPTQH